MYLKGIMVLLALMLVLGCQPTSDNSYLNDSAGYIETLMKNYGLNSMTLDLSDAQQYDYVKAAYLESGQTPENAPQLFADLEKARVDSAAITTSFNRAANVTVEDYIEDRAFMVSTVYSYKGRFYVSLTSTVKDGTSYTTMRLRITDVKTGKVLTTGPSGWVIKSEYAGGKCVVLTVDLPLPVANAWSAIKIEGLEQVSVKGIVKSTATIIKSLVGPDSNSLIEKIHIQEPIDKNNDGKVTIGIGRPVTTPADCTVATIDYPYDGCYNMVKVPWKGYFQVPYTVTLAQIDNINTYIKLSGPTYGGATEMMYQGIAGKTFKNGLKLTAAPGGGTLIEWNILRKDCWFNNAALFQPLAKVNWYYNFSFLNVEFFPGFIDNMTYAASSDSNASNLLPDLYPPYLAFCWSCIAQGSVVTMADGTMLPIEMVKIGDVVRSKGIDLTVISTAVGTESKPVIRIVDEDAHNLLVTETHAIMTKNKGMIAASALKKGDVIITERGVKNVVYVGGEKYEGKVYNLELGNGIEKNKMKNGDNMFYANGILVGDMVMQMAAEARMQE